MPEVRINNLVKFHTVCLLAERPQHGYDIIKAGSVKLGQAVSPGQIYPFLKQLQGAGYIRIQKTGDRDLKQYALTPAGQAFVKALFAKFSDIIHLSLQQQLKTCAHCGCEIYRGAHTEKIGGKSMPFCCASCAGAFRGQGR